MNSTVRSTRQGARIGVTGDAAAARIVAERLMAAISGLSFDGGARLSVGVGVSRPARLPAGFDRLATQAEEAATESLVAGDHVVVVAATPVRRSRLHAAAVRLYERASVRRRPALLVAASTALAVLPTFAVYYAVGALGFNLAGVMFWAVFAALSLTAIINYSEAFTAFDPPKVPADPTRWPPLTVIVSAYLANEVEVIVGTARALLAQAYPGAFEVIVAHNGPRRPAVEAELARIAASDPRLIVLAVPESTSKAQNVNAALDMARGRIVGIFDADHRPAPDSFRRAACWLGEGTGVDVVQGHCSVRNGDDGWMQRMVAIEFEAIYAVGHPGRAGLHQFAIFGGSNGFWRTDLLRRLRFRPRMLTEDIDVSVRALLEGAHIVSDPGLVSYELAPASGRGLWGQRTRWAQGWSQVSRAYWRQLLTTPALSIRQRLGGLWLTMWREAYSWVSAQMVPVMAYLIFVRHQQGIHWFLPFFGMSTLFTSAVGPIQSLFARRLAVPNLRQRDKRWWWWAYMLVWGAPYGEWRTAVCRAAHLREALGDHGWVVTPRAATQVVASFTGRGAADRGAAA